MTIRKQISTVLAELRQQNDSMAPLEPDLLYGLGSRSFPFANSMRIALYRRKLSFTGDLYISRVCRIVEFKPASGRSVMRVVAPIYRSLGCTLIDTVTFEIEIMEVDVALVGQRSTDYIVVNYDCLRQSPGYRTDYHCDDMNWFDVKEHELNPFDHIDPVSHNSWVHGVDGNGAIPTQQLISYMAFLFRYLSPVDRRLLDRLLAIDRRLDAFLKAPASISNHHAHPHGLLLHTVEVSLNTMLEYMDAGRPDGADLSLMVAGALLHDVGKLDEYVDLGLGNYMLSQTGALLGHTVKAAMWLYAAADGLDDRYADRVVKLAHCLTAVSREEDVGIYRRRKLVEAELINRADRRSAGFEAQRSVPWMVENDLLVFA